jgi:gliding motility-associated-like protein
MRGPIYFSTIGMVLFYLLGTSLLTEASAPITEDQCKLYVPNVFSPNGDGVNDQFVPASNCDFQEFEMRIFDRWGTLIYQSQNPDAGWNGKYNGNEVASTSYVYYIRYRNVPQDTVTETFTEVATGAVALLR